MTFQDSMASLPSEGAATLIKRIRDDRRNPDEPRIDGNQLKDMTFPDKVVRFGKIYRQGRLFGDFISAAEIDQLIDLVNRFDWLIELVFPGGLPRTNLTPRQAWRFWDYLITNDSLMNKLVEKAERNAVVEEAARNHQLAS